jgi:hypothetical protein
MAEAANSGVTLDLGHANASPFVREGGTLESFADVVMARVANVHVYAIETPEGRHEPLDTLNGHGRALDRLLAHARRTWVLELSNTEDLATTRRTLERYQAG